MNLFGTITKGTVRKYIPTPFSAPLPLLDLYSGGSFLVADVVLLAAFALNVSVK